MQFDILIPKNNEEELALRAKELGWKKVIFLKEFETKESIEKYIEILKDLPIKAEVGLLVKVRSKRDLLKSLQLKKLVSVIVAKSDGNEEINRLIFETKGIDYVINLASSSGRDHTHYRRGGVNQVLAKLAKENGIAYAISFSDYFNEENRVLLLGRWMFNAKIFNKYKVSVNVFSFASKAEDVRSADSLDEFRKSLCRF